MFRSVRDGGEGRARRGDAAARVRAVVVVRLEADAQPRRAQLFGSREQFRPHRSLARLNLRDLVVHDASRLPALLELREDLRRGERRRFVEPRRGREALERGAAPLLLRLLPLQFLPQGLGHASGDVDVSLALHLLALAPARQDPLASFLILEVVQELVALHLGVFHVAFPRVDAFEVSGSDPLEGVVAPAPRVHRLALVLLARRRVRRGVREVRLERGGPALELDVRGDESRRYVVVSVRYVRLGLGVLQLFGHLCFSSLDLGFGPR